MCYSFSPPLMRIPIHSLLLCTRLHSFFHINYPLPYYERNCPQNFPLLLTLYTFSYTHTVHLYKNLLSLSSLFPYLRSKSVVYHRFLKPSFFTYNLLLLFLSTVSSGPDCTYIRGLLFDF